jgi:hypothetical protein
MAGRRVLKAAARDLDDTAQVPSRLPVRVICELCALGRAHARVRATSQRDCARSP